MPSRTQDTSAPPHKIAGISNAVQIGVGIYHACVRLEDGTVMCWGTGTGTPCGDEAPPVCFQAEPKAIPKLTDAVDLAVGGQSTIIVRADGSLFLGGWTDFAAAAGAAVTDAVRVTGAQETACYIDRGARGHCIGGFLGSLGDGTRDQQFHFSTMLGTSRLTQVSSGSHTCTIDEAGTASCCGENHYGEIGDGTTVERDVLTPVRF